MKLAITILLTPIFVLYHVFKKMLALSTEIGYPIVEGITIILNYMYFFWKDVFKWK